VKSLRVTRPQRKYSCGRPLSVSNFDHTASAYERMRPSGCGVREGAHVEN
jgi:hypothetical protein